MNEISGDQIFDKFGGLEREAGNAGAAKAAWDEAQSILENFRRDHPLVPTSTAAVVLKCQKHLWDQGLCRYARGDGRPSREQLAD